MNPLIKTARALMLFSILTLAWSCSKDSDPTPKDLIIGDWTVKSLNVTIKVGTQSLLDYLKSFGFTDEEAQLYVSQLENEFETNGQSFNIQKGGTYTTTSQGVTETGTWELSSDGKTFTVDKGTTEAVVFTVTTLTSGSLNLTGDQSFSDSGMTFTVHFDMAMTK